MGSTFTQKFTEVWSDPAPEKFVVLLDPQVILYQPYAPPVRGRDHAFLEFKRMLEWLPGLHGVVRRSMETEDVAFIEWSMKLPIGKRTLSLGVVDRFLLRDGLVIERRTFFDRVPIFLRALKHPKIAFGYLKFIYGSGGSHDPS